MRGIRIKKYENYNNRPEPQGYGKKRRFEAGFLNLLWRQNMLVFSVALLVFSVLSQVLTPLIVSRSAQLTPEMYNLTGQSRDDTNEYLQLSDDGSSYSFKLPETEDANAVHTGRVADAYSASLSADPKEGVTVTEKNSKISVTLVPDFYTQSGQKVEGDHIVYPTGPDKLVYTLKYNGLKEDIIVPEYRADELSYTFTLRLPAGVEARLDAQGNIGIYSGNPSLFGDISFGSDEDRQRVEKARQNGEKNNLVMTIPFPVIKDSSGQEYTDRSNFELSEKQTSENQEVRSDLPADIPRSMVTNNDYQLTIKSERLHELSYPVAIDPTIQVKAANNFEGVTQDGGLDIDTANSEIRRSSLSGGVTDSWAAFGHSLTIRHRFATAIYNNYIYMIGGTEADGSGTFMDDVEYAPIDSSGDTGSWSLTTNLPQARTWHEAKAYDGYLYVFGGQVGGSAVDTVIYAPINSDGTVGSWSSTASLNTVRRSFRVEAHDGYFYALGGETSGGTVVSSVEYAPILADGSVGSWTTSSTSLPDVRRWHGSAQYNDNLYIAGGVNGATSLYATTYHAKILDDHTVSTWTQTANLANGNRQGFGMIAHKGYVYAYDGCTTAPCSNVNLTNSTEYAEIRADGSLGSWRLGKTGFNAVANPRLEAMNGRIYVLGGCSVFFTNCTNGSGSDLYGDIKPAGELHGTTWDTTTVMPVSRYGHESVAFNGYMYLLGGFGGGSYNNTVHYAAINADGTLGSWTATNNFSTGREGHSVEIANGYIYVTGGFKSASDTSCHSSASQFCSDVQYAAINSNGSIGTWASTTSFTNQRSYHTSAVYNGRIYILGGVGSGMHNDVQYATLNSNGTVSSWTATTSFTTARNGHTSVLYGQYMYIMGGCSAGSCTTYHNDVQYAAINSNGTISSWATSTSFTTARRYHTSVVQNGYIYTMGGCSAGSCTTYHNDVQYAPIKADGSVGSWASTTSFTTARFAHSSTVYRDKIYTMGGYDGSTTRTDVQLQSINNGGSGALSDWAVDPADFFSVRKIHASVAHNGYLYVIGGCVVSNCGTATTNTTGNIAYAPINADGSVGTWLSTTNTFALSRMRHMSFVYNDRLYVMGGRRYESGGQDLDDIQHSPINSDGNINTTWTTDDTDLPGGSGHFGASATVYGNTVYFTGGSNTTGQDDVYYAVINESTGDVGAWTETTSRPTTSRNSWFGNYNGYIYSFGGQLSGTASVYFAPINGDRTIGTWNSTTSLPFISHSNTAASVTFLNGYVYIPFDLGPGNIPLTYYTSIGSDGRLGTWQATERPDYGAGSSYLNFAVTEYEGRVYVTGGHITGTGCDPCNQTTYTTINSTPRTGSFTRRYDFESGVKPTKLITRGSQATAARIDLVYADSAACGATAYDTAITNNRIGYNGSNALDINIGASQTLARCLVLRYTIDDTQSAVFPDDGNESTITDFDLYFTANPGNRLRGGRSFINGQDRGLDAAPQ